MLSGCAQQTHSAARVWGSFCPCIPVRTTLGCHSFHHRTVHGGIHTFMHSLVGYIVGHVNCPTCTCLPSHISNAAYRHESREKSATCTGARSGDGGGQRRQGAAAAAACTLRFPAQPRSHRYVVASHHKHCVNESACLQGSLTHPCTQKFPRTLPFRCCPSAISALSTAIILSRCKTASSEVIRSFYCRCHTALMVCDASLMAWRNAVIRW